MCSGFQLRSIARERGVCVYVCVCVGSWSEFGTKNVDQNAKQIKVQVIQYLDIETSQVMPAFF